MLDHCSFLCQTLWTRPCYGCFYYPTAEKGSHSVPFDPSAAAQGFDRGRRILLALAVACETLRGQQISTDLVVSCLVAGQRISIDLVGAFPGFQTDCERELSVWNPHETVADHCSDFRSRNLSGSSISRVSPPSSDFGFLMFFWLPPSFLSLYVVSCLVKLCVICCFLPVTGLSIPTHFNFFGFRVPLVVMPTFDVICDQGSVHKTCLEQSLSGEKQRVALLEKVKLVVGRPTTTIINEKISKFIAGC